SSDLRLVVDRDRSIADFVPLPFWSIEVQLLGDDPVPFTAQWRAPDEQCDDQGRCLDQRLAQQAADAMRAVGSAKLQRLKTERMREASPLPFDLGTLQDVGSKKLG